MTAVAQTAVWETHRRFFVAIQIDHCQTGAVKQQLCLPAKLAGNETDADPHSGEGKRGSDVGRCGAQITAAAGARRVDVRPGCAVFEGRVVLLYAREGRRIDERLLHHLRLLRKVLLH